MGRVESGGITMLLDLDDCIGCYGCAGACHEVNMYPYEEDWMEVIRRKPVLVDGKLRGYHLVAPSLDKCAICVQENPVPLCIKSCPAKAIKIGTFEEMAKEAAGRHCALFTA